MRIVRVFTCVFVALLLAGCSGRESNVEQGNRDQVFHIANGTEPQSLDPHLATDRVSSNIINTLLEGLVSLELPSLEPAPAAAERWEISDDGKIYTFHLRKNARWSNGDPLTAEDFVWSWWRALQPALGNQYAYMLFAVRNAKAYVNGEITDFDQVGVKAVDSHTLVVELENPTPYFLQLLAHQSAYPVHRPTLEALGEAKDRGINWTRPGNYVGNGAFTLEDWQLYKRIKVRKNPHYWGADKVRLNGVVFHPVENESTEERMFRAGQLHATYTLSIDKIEVYRREQPELLRQYPIFSTYFYLINVNHPILKDKRIRRALNLAIDRQAIVDSVTKAGERPAVSLTPPDTMGYTATSDLRFDPEEAKRLLSEAGYPDGKGIPKLTLIFNTNEGHQKIAVAIQRMWSENLNLDIGLENQEWKVYLNTTNLKNFEIARYGWSGDYVDPNTFLDLYVTDGGNNDTGWSNERYDEIVLKLAPTEPDVEKRHKLLQEAEAILLEELPIIPIYYYYWKRLVQPNVRGMVDNAMDQINYKDIWLDNPA